MGARDIDELERLVAATGNPVFAWEVLTLCETPGDLPAWVWSCLRGCATRLIDLDPDPKRLHSTVLDALWLSGSGGPGAFRMTDTARRRHHALQAMVTLIGQGMTVDKAAEAGSSKTELSSSTLRGYYFEARRDGRLPEFCPPAVDQIKVVQTNNGVDSCRSFPP